MNGVSVVTEQPSLLFLHGVGTGDLENSWKTHLSGALMEIGFPGLETVETFAPKYSDLLSGADGDQAVPKVTVSDLPSGEAKIKRREFEQSIAAMEYRLGRHAGGNGGLIESTVVDVAVGIPFFRQARNYLSSPTVRAQVLTRVLQEIPQSGPLVIVGHSLGSVIAADLLRRLPQTVQVIGLVTIGSPLANGNFNVDKLLDVLREPPANLGWWVNFWSNTDPVAARRGVSSVFPWILDVLVRTSPVPLEAHSAAQYLSDISVAEAIGFGLFGSRSREVVLADNGVDIALDDVEILATLALRYAHLIKRELKGDQLNRYSAALRRVQAALIDEIKTRNRAENRPIPGPVAALGFDFADPDAEVPEPRPSRHFSGENAVTTTIALATENILRPYEIFIKDEVRHKALSELTAEMGLGTQFGSRVFTALDTATRVLAPANRKSQLLKWGTLSAGALAIVAASGGLALAAAPGLAGAAVITSALASFGPGGMIGGLLTAGALVSTGGGGIAVGMMSPGTSVESMEAVVHYQLAIVVLRELQQYEQDPTIWRDLTQAERKLHREIERIDEFSDAQAPSVIELKRKLTAVERALKYMSDKRLEPAGALDDFGEPPTPRMRMITPRILRR